MLHIIINKVVSYLRSHEIPHKNNAFLVQKQVLQRLIGRYNNSPLYKNIWLKQDKSFSLLWYDETALKLYLSQYPLIEYTTHILPFVEYKQGITHENYDLLIRTSGTSDANQWGKLIPANWFSLKNERTGMQRTLSCYLSENPSSKIFFKKAFMLTASFDSAIKIWYVSGVMRYTNKMYKYAMFPSDKILSLTNRKEKKKEILSILLSGQIQIWTFHGVPTRSLEILHALLQQDIQKTSKILSSTEYVSIWWWPSLDYKQQFQDIIYKVWLKQKIYASNNHNASEGFLWSQVRFFDDLSYHWMSPMMQTNFFIFFPIELFYQYQSRILSYQDLVLQSHLLHEIEANREYIIVFANDRIPWLYNIKDKVIFKDNNDGMLEYIVTWRYGMASNVFNEHLEYDHLVYAIERLIHDGYLLDKNNCVAWMQLVDNTWILHIIVESSWELNEKDNLRLFIDSYLSEANDQWKLFREREKIKDLVVYTVSPSFIRDNLIMLGKMHEQSKIPHLSDHNYEQIIQPLLKQIKNSL